MSNIAASLSYPTRFVVFAFVACHTVNYANSQDLEVAAAESCAILKDAHGIWSGLREPGGTYVLSCDGGYEVQGHHKANVECLDSLHWSARPWCEEVDDCKKLVYGCGPAGLCVDRLNGYECLCEHGAQRKKMENDEAICVFQGDNMWDCGGRNCGAHGVCINLKHYQQTFDVGSGAFRCSCESGYEDDGHTCKEVDCGQLKDVLGSWSGNSRYRGEYTLECNEGAFVGGGTRQATTISCPSSGEWGVQPKCQSPAQVSQRAFQKSVHFWLEASCAILCVCAAAVAAGLTMGLVSLEPRELEIIQTARLDDCSTDKERDRLSKQKDAARTILPLLKDRHLLLVTLLLLNAVANEALPVFLDGLVSKFTAVLLSVTFVLICGEIVPSAVFTGPMQISMAASCVPAVNCLVSSLFFVAKPIASLLDKGLPHEHGNLHTRPELHAVLRLHSTSGDISPRSHSSAKNLLSPRAGSQDSILDEDLERSSTFPGATIDEHKAPIDALEAELCIGVFKLGDTTVIDSPGLYTLRLCSRHVYPASSLMRIAETAAEAAKVRANFIMVFESLDSVSWPTDVPIDGILGVLRLSELLAEDPRKTLRTACHRKQRVCKLDFDQSVTDAVVKISDTCDTPCGFGVVLMKAEFFGLFCGEEALMQGLLATKNHSTSPTALISPSSPFRRASQSAYPSSSSSRSLDSSDCANVFSKSPSIDAAKENAKAFMEAAIYFKDDPCIDVVQKVPRSPSKVRFDVDLIPSSDADEPMSQKIEKGSTRVFPLKRPPVLELQRSSVESQPSPDKQQQQVPPSDPTAAVAEAQDVEQQLTEDLRTAAAVVVSTAVQKALLTVAEQQTLQEHTKVVVIVDGILADLLEDVSRMTLTTVVQSSPG